MRGSTTGSEVTNRNARRRLPRLRSIPCGSDSRHTNRYVAFRKKDWRDSEVSRGVSKLSFPRLSTGEKESLFTGLGLGFNGVQTESLFLIPLGIGFCEASPLLG